MWVMENSTKLYLAMIWVADPTIPGKRVSVLAKSLNESQELLEAEYGVGNVYYLRDEGYETRPR